MSQETDTDRIVDRIYEALDAGDGDTALATAREAIRTEGEDPVLRFLAGVACTELDRPADAAVELQRAVELDPDDAEFRASYAFALFKGCRFDEAHEQATRAAEGDPGMPDAWYVRGLTLERRGDLEQADRCFAEAARLDPERFRQPPRVERATFEDETRRAGELLPEVFQERLAEIAVTVDELPSNSILLDSTPPLDPELLGLFVGTSLIEHSVFDAGSLPPRILLFQRNLERFAVDERSLREEIARTLHHELAHYLGFDEEDMEPMDLA